MTATVGAEERAQLGEAVRRSLERSAGPRPFFPPPDGAGGIDRELWTVLAEQIGVTALLVPSEAGGVGGTISDAVVVFEELGATLAPVPAFATVGLATTVLLGVGGPLLERLAEGATIVTLAWDAGVDPQGPSAEVRAAPGRLDGRASFVVSGDVADLFLVPTDLGLFAVDAQDVTRRALPALDLTRGVAEVRFDGAPATLLAEPDEARDAVSAGLDLALVMLAAEQVGLAQRCLDDAVAYAKQRVQFGRPIGSFQAIKHKLVDLLLQVELARSAMLSAADTADAYLADPDGDSVRALRASASAAKALCSEAAMTVAAESLHVFGGIGFTWEHDAHLYFRRAKSTQLLFGDADWHRRRLSAAAGL